MRDWNIKQGMGLTPQISVLFTGVSAIHKEKNRKGNIRGQNTENIQLELKEAKQRKTEMEGTGIQVAGYGKWLAVGPGTGRHGSGH